MDSILPPGLAQVSAELVRARALACALPGPPSGLPETLEDAYRIQDCSIADWDGAVAGWKVGGVPPDYVERFGETRLAGPIFAASVQTVAEGEVARMPVFAGGFAAIEPEFVFQLGASEQDDRLFIGAEIASSPIPDINSYGPVAVICDFGNNNGLLLGAEIRDWKSIDAAARVTTYIDEEMIATKSLADFRTDALAALAFLRTLANARGYPLTEGTYVSSGAITGVHEAPVGARSQLDFGALGAFELELVRAEPL
ncbi:MAG: 2-keto-4-pentenoate hydratase [Alteraurantiacibacter sp.]